MEDHDKPLGDDQPSADAAPDLEKEGVVERAPTQRPKGRNQRRKDNNRLHVIRHGILSRAPLEALVGRGENLRELRKIERMLRAELKPKGIIAEIFFDRAWSSYLRCLLIADAEKQVFTTADHQADTATRLPSLAEWERPTLVFSDNGKVLDDFSPDLLRHLAIVQRYDGHFSREFYRAVGALLVLKMAGETGLKLHLAEMFGQKKQAGR